MQGTLTVIIEKLVFGGQGLAHTEDGKPIFVWNALPGEKVVVGIRKKKPKFIEGVAIEILEASSDRQAPICDHYLSTSPWQIMPPEKELFYKKDIVLDTYKKIGRFEPPNDVEIVSDLDAQFGYRNKVEFSFCDKNFVQPKKRPKDFVPEPEDIAYAFYERGTVNRIPVDKSYLAHPAIQSLADEILPWVHEEGITNRTLKSLVIRSNMKGETIAALFVKDEIEFGSYPTLPDTCLGFHIYYSSHKCPAARPDKLLYSIGQHFLTEPLLGTELKYGLLSFFQVNIPIFEETLKDIAQYLDPNKPMVDFYSGVGSIGIPLHASATSCICVDSNEEAIDYAQDNIAVNDLNNCEAHCTPAEKMTDIISSEKIIIVDPPRAGMHEDVIAKLLEAQPERIIYLSCNITTQARDIDRLSEVYHVTFSKLYNYFPRTPHIEALCILEKKQ